MSIKIYDNIREWCGKEIEIWEPLSGGLKPLEKMKVSLKILRKSEQRPVVWDSDL